MCYSSLVRGDLKQVRRDLGADIDIPAFVDLFRQRETTADLKIPSGLAASLIALLSDSEAGEEIAHLEARFLAAVTEQRLAELAELDRLIAELAAEQLQRPTKTRAKTLDAKRRKRNKLAAPESSSNGDYRIYPYQFAPLIISRNGQRVIVPARYRVLPRTGVEVPNQYNVFNARRDSLQHAQNWKPLFGRKHGLFPFLSFFEWVQRDGKAVELQFSPEGYSGMWAAALYEETPMKAGGVLRSFAMVTDEPPAEVAAAGHDRCPVFLDPAVIDPWLQPAGQSLAELDALLDHKAPTFYQHAAVA